VVSDDDVQRLRAAIVRATEWALVTAMNARL